MKKVKYSLIALAICMVVLFATSAPALSANVQAAYNKMSNDLLSAFSKAGSNSSMNVIVWLEDNSTEEYQSIVSAIPVPQFSSRTDSANEISIQSLSSQSSDLTEEERLEQIEAYQNYIMQKRQIAQAVYLEDNTAVANQLSSYGEIVYISRYSPLIICNLNQSEALNVAKNSSVLSLDNGETKLENEMANSTSAFGIGYPHSLNAKAQGIIIGMLEVGVPDTSYDSFDGIESKIHTEVDTMSEPFVTDYFKLHASLVASIIVGTDYGIARDFESFYAIATPEEADFYKNVETLLSEGVNVINFSYSIGKDSQYSDEAKWLDHIAYNHSVHCVMASGNRKDEEDGIVYDVANASSNLGMAYNVITVGAVSDNNTFTPTDDTLYVDSCYNQTHNNLAYKPDLSSYGVDIVVPGIISSSYSGTSLAAPHVTGLVAVLCSRKPELLIAQDQMKAILTCSTVKAKYNHNTSDSEYRRFGAGIANAKNATFLIDNGTYQGGSITSSENRDYISLGTLSAGSKVTVSLSFLKRSKFTTSAYQHEENIGFVESALADLDVYIAPVVAMPIPFTKNTYTQDESSANPRFNYVYRSITPNNNVEKVTFVVPTTCEYILTINKEAVYDSYEVLYGIAWQVQHSGMT